MISIRWDDETWYEGEIESRMGAVLQVKYPNYPIVPYNLKTHKEGRDWKMCARDTYKGVAPRKIAQNEALVQAYMEHCSGYPSTARACVIDAEGANSTRALMDAGFKGPNITVANWDAGIAAHIHARTGADVVHGSFSMALARGAFRKNRYSVVYADFCGMLMGAQRAALGYLFDAKLLLPHSVLAVTICTRLHERTDKDHAAARDAHSYVKKLAKRNGYNVERATHPTQSHYTEKGKQTMAHLVFRLSSTTPK
jgi:hypothetical protein